MNSRWLALTPVGLEQTAGEGFPRCMVRHECTTFSSMQGTLPRDSSICLVVEVIVKSPSQPDIGCPKIHEVELGPKKGGQLLSQSVERQAHSNLRLCILALDGSNSNGSFRPSSIEIFRSFSRRLNRIAGLDTVDAYRLKETDRIIGQASPSFSVELTSSADTR